MIGRGVGTVDIGGNDIDRDFIGCINDVVCVVRRSKWDTISGRISGAKDPLTIGNSGARSRHVEKDVC